MTDLVFITGNQQKADYLAKWLGMPMKHQKVDLEELQSLDLREVVEDKARRAYAVVQKPVLVEDVALTFTAMGRLPGTFIKWFLEEMGDEKLCRLADGLEHRSAEAAIMYALYDGADMHLFEAHQQGSIAQHPLGTNGFGWNYIFIPDGQPKTYGEMDEATFKQWSIRAHAIEKLKAFLAA
ncbi:MAG TPA: non-canonical purine NTP pyrophosphatase [Candidatus Saccharimonadales bacterium]|jgi:non-canonical purine NTP pyrophosphatase (RdgB/HAM1 family)|nr:non-canonical purine NTP pyrophosphatase [Candidatus Saccharimonadales bacterium]